MSKQIEELLRPRYKVIADWPGNVWPIGTIYKHETIGILNPKKCDDFPHLFKKLAWYEDRKPEEMPDYVRVVEKSIIEYGNVYKVDFIEKREPNTLLIKVGGFINPLLPHHFSPATREEYDNYQHSKPKTI